MSVDPRLGAVGILAAALLLLAALVKAWPTLWGFLCLPGRVEERLKKLDGLDAIAANAQQAIDEWRGATEAVNAIAGDHGARLTELERWRRTVDRERKAARP
jgi:hypothetical protein